MLFVQRNHMTQLQLEPSVGNYLIGKYIKQNTDITVVFNGDGSDEQSGYYYLSSTPFEFQDV